MNIINAWYWKEVTQTGFKEPDAFGNYYDENNLNPSNGGGHFSEEAAFEAFNNIFITLEFHCSEEYVLIKTYRIN